MTLSHSGEIVGDQDGRRARPAQRPDSAEALLLERAITDGEHFVDQQDVGIEVCGDREAEPDVHARRVPLHRHVDKRCNARKLDDLFELGRDLAAPHAQNRAAQVNVLAARELRVEA